MYLDLELIFYKTEQQEEEEVVIDTPVEIIPGTSISSWFTQELWDIIFPYSKASICYSPQYDPEPFWTYSAFLDAVKWLNSHENKEYHNFGTDSEEHYINQLEVAAFLANCQQETGDPSLKVPYPWGWPVVEPKGLIHEGPAGGCINIIEGAATTISLGDIAGNGDLKRSATLTQKDKEILGTTENIIVGMIQNLSGANQPGFGLGTGNVAFLPGLCAVSGDGTLYGDYPLAEKEIVRPTSELVSNSGPRYASTGVYSQYGGRSQIQLSYNYNYSECSIALFNDYRLVKYPNLLITIDRKNFLGIPKIFGFPGPNPDGNNQLPEYIDRTTPNARVMGMVSALWFWMDRNRSGRKISCHQAMLSPFTHGITVTNMIVNNQSGCTPSWAADKNRFYERILRIFKLDKYNNTIVCPVHPDANRPI